MPSVRFAVDRDFYPRSPCGERLAKGLRENALTANFYPRSPCGERQERQQLQQELAAISIHALLAESDLCRPAFAPAAHNFYPRSPCGERLSKRRLPSSCRRFLSTLSLRRATRQCTALCMARFISIHALLAESDLPN